MASKVKSAPVSTVLGKGNKFKKQTISKVTSIGLYGKPKNKHRRRTKPYIGQGRP